MRDFAKRLDSLEQDILNANDLDGYDFVVLSLTADALLTGRHDGETAAAAFERVGALVAQVRAKTAAPVIVNTLVRPLSDEGGASYALRPDSLASRIDSFNRQLRDFVHANSPKCLLVDWERIVMLIGAEAAFDRRMGYVASAPFRHKFLNVYAWEIFRIGRAAHGLGKKCLILDCDDTLWGGIVGEVGLEGIALNPNDYPGKVYYDFQRAVLRLAAKASWWQCAARTIRMRSWPCWTSIRTA